MRDILFRGKSLATGKWVFGSFDASDCGIIHDAVVPNDPIIPDTLGEYIGVTDKKRNMIFEGDIVKTKYGRLCKVVWFRSNQYCGFDLVPINDRKSKPDQWDLYESRNLEVVGNIYDALSKFEEE